MMSKFETLDKIERAIEQQINIINSIMKLNKEYNHRVGFKLFYEHIKYKYAKYRWSRHKKLLEDVRKRLTNQIEVNES